MLIVIWLICAIISTTIAQSKGRSPIEGALLGGLLGLIGVLIEACLPKITAS